MRCTSSAPKGWPSKVMVPLSGTVMRLMMRMSVVLPAPLGPSRPKTRPRGTLMLTPSSAVCVPKRLTMFSAVRKVSGVMSV